MRKRVKMIALTGVAIAEISIFFSAGWLGIHFVTRHGQSSAVACTPGK